MSLCLLWSFIPPWMNALTPRPRRFTPGKKTRYPLYRRPGVPRGRFGRVGKISPPTGVCTPDRTARSESLYGLRYPGRLNVNIIQSLQLHFACNVRCPADRSSKGSVSLGVCRGWLRNYSLHKFSSIERIECPRV